MGEPDARHHLEQFASEMLCGTISGRTVIDLIRIGFRVGYEFRNRLCRKRRTYRHDIWKSNDARYRCDVVDEIEGKSPVECRVDCVRRAAQQEGVTIGGRTNGCLGG